MFRNLFIVFFITFCCLLAPGAAHAERVISNCDTHNFPGPAPTHIGAFATDCFMYADRDAYQYVIYPDRWGETPDAEHMLLLNYALDALNESRTTYVPYQSEFLYDLPFTADLVVVLTDEIPPGRDAGLTAADISDHVRPCWMALNPVAWDEGKTFFKFVIAHEAAHCFFRDTLHASVENFQLWWSEGAAEFMASVVYPAFDFEQAFAEDYTTINPMTDYCLRYPTVAFFQHYANAHGGPGAVLRFVRRMNTAGNAVDLRRLLADEAGFADYFHKFAQDLNSRKIADPGGGFFPLPYSGEATVSGDECHWTERDPFWTTLEGEDGASDFVLNVTPLAAEVRVFTVNPGYHFRLSELRVDSGEAVASYARTPPSRTAPSFQDWSGEIVLQGNCEAPVEYLVMITSTDPATTDRNVRFTATPEEIETCDPCPAEQVALDSCMQGSWRMDDTGYAAVIEQFREMVEGQGGEPADVAASVAYDVMQIYNQTMICRPNRYETMGHTEVKASGGNDEMRATLHINHLGSSAGHICTNRENHTVRFVSEFDQLVDHDSYLEVTGGGRSMRMPLTPTASFLPAGEEGEIDLPYQCSGNKLVLTVKDPHTNESVDFEFRRMTPAEIEQDGRLPVCMR